MSTSEQRHGYQAIDSLKSPGRSGRKISPLKKSKDQLGPYIMEKSPSPSPSPSKDSNGRKIYRFKTPNVSPTKIPRRPKMVNPFIDHPKVTVKQESPKKLNDIDMNIDEEEARLRLRSPRKRTMNDLNLSARKRAVQFKALQLGNTELNDDDLTLVDRIINESRKDGLGGLNVESDDEKTVESLSESDDYQDAGEQEDESDADFEEDFKELDSIIIEPKRSKARSPGKDIMKLKELKLSPRPATSMSKEDLLIAKESQLKRETSVETSPNEKSIKIKKKFKLKGPSLKSTSSVSPLRQMVETLKSADLEQDYFGSVENEDKDIKNKESIVKKEPTKDSPRRSIVIEKTSNSNGNSTQQTTSPIKTKKSVQLMRAPSNLKSKDELLKIKSDTDRSIFYDGYEGFFEQNKLSYKKSSSSMTSAPGIDYEDYHRHLTLMKFINYDQRNNIINYYRTQYPQFMFEVLNGFNLIFYGLGSKRSLALEFVKYLIPKLFKFDESSDSPPKCIVVNGYNSSTNLKLLVKEIYSICFNLPNASLPLLLLDAISNIDDLFKASRTQNNKFKIPKLVILIHNIDGESLRTDKHQQLLAALANLPEISIIATMDNVNTPIFWNADLNSKFNFCWHAVTNFETYASETTFKDPLSIGKSNKFVGSKGATYVLTSVTSNARSLYRNLLIQQIEAIDKQLDSKSAKSKEKISRGTVKGGMKYSINFKDFFNLCLNEFITSNENNFRIILKEFLEHKMATLNKNTAGIEMLFVPYTIDEMEKLLTEELLE